MLLRHVGPPKKVLVYDPRFERSPNIVSSAWRSITLSARPMIARLRTVPCVECARPIRVWDARIWLIEGERWAHSQCWKRRLFFEGYMQSTADEIRGQIKRDEFPPARQPDFQRSDDASSDAKSCSTSKSTARAFCLFHQLPECAGTKRTKTHGCKSRTTRAVAGRVGTESCRRRGNAGSEA
jgi:hypothetical protein